MCFMYQLDVQRGLSEADTIGTLLSVPNRGVCLFRGGVLIQGLYSRCYSCSGTEDGVRYTEVSCIQGRVPLYMYIE